jgi:hypothetical protein
LPWRLTVRPDCFDYFAWGALEGLSLACLPVTAWLWPRKSRRALWFCGAILACGTVLWFQQVQLVRYLLPLYPLMALFAALNVTTVWSVLARRTRVAACWSVLFLVVGLGWFTATRWWSVKGNWEIAEHYPYRLALGLESSDHFLRRTLPHYEALQYLAALGERSAVKVVQYPHNLRLYGGDCQFYYWGSFSPKKTEPCLPPEEALALTLAENGIDFIMVIKDPNDPTAVQARGTILDPLFLQNYCREELVSGRGSATEVRLYRFLGSLVPSPPVPAPAAIAQRNTGWPE